MSRNSNNEQQMPDLTPPIAAPAPEGEGSVSDRSEIGTDGLAETIEFSGAIAQGLVSASVPSEIPTAFGRYEVRGILGKGGFATVYFGFDRRLNRPVAIKVPHVHLTADDVETEFVEEARRLAQLKHPGIVTVFDVDVHEGRCYIVSDFIRGQSLNQWLKHHRPGWSEAARIVADVASALMHAHEQRTVHRDVKPSNIILTEENKPVLIDFGVAISDTGSSVQRGLIAGTVSYMSPEQASGERKIDGRSDIYSLGVVFYLVLSGRLPFRAPDNQELLRQICFDAPPALLQLVPEIPRDLERICFRALAKRPMDRYPTAVDMVADLRRFLNAQSETVQLPAQSRDHSGAAGGESSSQTPSAIRRAREAERRQVTLMICNCDLKDPSDHLATLDAEEQHDLLLAFQRVCEDVVVRFGGMISQSTGQELMVCFGYPVGFEDAAQRALRAALGIMDQMAPLNQDLQRQSGLQLSAWIAIHTGHAVVGDLGGIRGIESLSIVGEARNLASRLEREADPDSIVISEATYRLVQGFFECQSLGRRRFKGFMQPIEVFEVVGESQATSRIDVAKPAGLTPLIGRDREVALLSQRWELARDGIGQVVLLIGDAGLGKSRLVHVLKEHVTEESPGLEIPVVEWRCSPYHVNSALYPAIEFFERRLNFAIADSPLQKLDQLVAYLEPLGFADAENITLLAELLSVPVESRFPPLTLSPQRRKEKLQEALLELLRAVGGQQPLLFVVEDLHWADPSTLEFLGLLAEQGFADRRLTLLTFRPEFDAPWKGKAHNQIVLNRLTDRQVGELLQRKLGASEISADVVAQIADRTDGVPLFVEEFIKMLQESAMLQQDAGCLQLSDSSNLAAIPVTLQDLLIARLDRIAGVRDVAQWGASLGREFSYELIQAVAELDEMKLREELGKLVHAEILFQKGRPPRCTYNFKHALIQDAAYQSLLKKKRQQFHQRIAETLEQRFGETAESQPELLAHHFTEAREKEKAIAYWLKAGQRCQARSAVAEAIDHLSKGCKLLQTLPQSPQRDARELEIQMSLGSVLIQAKGYAAAEVAATFQHARTLCERIGPGAPLFHVTLGMWMFHLVRADLDDCMRLACEIMRLADAQADPGAVMEAHFALGCTLYYRGEFARAAQHASQGGALYDADRCRFHAQFTGQNSGVALMVYGALALWNLGYADQAVEQAQQAVQLAASLADPFSHCVALFHCGWLHYYCGSASQVNRCAEAGVAVAHEPGFVFYENLAVTNRGAAMLLEEDIDPDHIQKGIDEIRHGLSGFLSTGAGVHLSHPYSMLADALCRLGKFDEAQAELANAFQHARRSNELFGEAELYRIQGEILLARSTENQHAAEQAFRKAIEIALLRESRAWQLRATVSLSHLLIQQGRQNEARAALSDIYNRFTEGFQTRDLIRAKTLLDQL